MKGLINRQIGEISAISIVRQCAGNTDQGCLVAGGDVVFLREGAKALRAQAPES